MSAMDVETNGNAAEHVTGDAGIAGGDVVLNGNHDKSNDGQTTSDEDACAMVAKIKARLSAEITDDVSQVTNSDQSALAADDTVAMETSAADEVAAVGVAVGLEEGTNINDEAIIPVETESDQTMHSNDNTEVLDDAADDQPESNVEIPDDNTPADTGTEDEVSEGGDRRSFIELEDSDSNRQSFIQIPEESELVSPETDKQPDLCEDTETDSCAITETLNYSEMQCTEHEVEEEAPHESEEAPQESEEAPQESEEAPQESEEAPQEAEEAPQEAEEAPQEVEEAPQEVEEAPQEADVQETKAEVPEQEVEVAPESEVTFQEAEAPEQEIEDPEQETEVPEQETEVPEQATEVPEQEAEVPEQEAEVPEQEVEVPEQKAEVPEQEAEVPEQEAEVPEQEAEVPEQEAEVPEQEAEVPEQEAEVPEQEVEVPEQEAEVPVQEAEVAAQEDQMVEAKQDMVESLQTLVDEVTIDHQPEFFASMNEQELENTEQDFDHKTEVELYACGQNEGIEHETEETAEHRMKSIELEAETLERSVEAVEIDATENDVVSSDEAAISPDTCADVESSPEMLESPQDPESEPVFVGSAEVLEAATPLNADVVDDVTAKKQRYSQYLNFEGEDMKIVEMVTTSQKIQIRSSRENSLDLLDGPDAGANEERDTFEAEDKLVDDRENMPSLKNIKSRFENADENKRQAERPQPGKLKQLWNADEARNRSEVSPSPPRDPDIVREQRLKEEVPITSGGIRNIKQQYLESVKKPESSKAPPPPVEIPRQEFKRSEPSPSPSRDPDVVRSDDVMDEGQYLPPPQMTKGLVARFKQMEVEQQGQASQSPQRRPPAPANNVHAAYRKPNAPTPEPRFDLLDEERQIPDSGEFENQPNYREDVVREWDEGDGQDMPEVGAAKARINMFRQIERENVVKPPPSFGEMYQPSSGAPMVNGDPRQQNRGKVSSDKSVNGSPSRSQPDVIRHEEYNSDERPPQDLTKSMLSKFRQLETQAKSQKEQEWISPRRNEKSNEKPVTIASKWQPSVNGQEVVERPLFNPACPEGGEYENNPIDLPDVVRESDPYDENELPEVGVTRNLLAKFQSMQT